MIRIVVDSTSEINQEEAKKLNIDVIPLSVTFNQKTFKDQIEIDNGTFYKMLSESSSLPTTSQPSPEDFYNVFKKYEGDEIVGIFLSSKLSGTFQSAYIAKNMIENNDNIHLVDSKNATVCETILIHHAIKLRDANKSAKEITAELNELVDRVRLVAYIDTIKYLQMGGRISGLKAVLANSLNISPLISIEDGAISNLSKVRSKKKAFSFISEFINSKPIDYNYKVGLAGFDADEEVNKLKELVNDGDIIVNELGPVIGTHAGPKAFAIAYIEKK